MQKFNLFTVGYTSFCGYKAKDFNLPDGITEFVSSLHKHKIKALVDVRSSPYSAGYEQFNTDNLREVLPKNNIYYLFFGEGLGARPSDTGLYTNDRADFEKMGQSDIFLSCCSRIYKGLDNYNICLLCAEKDPIECHRAILVSNTFRNLYESIKIYHILPNNKIISQEQLDERIMNQHKIVYPDLFMTPYKELLKRAYKAQEQKIAYKAEVEYEAE